MTWFLSWLRPSQVLAEGLLRFAVRIAVTLIEGVGTVADYIRAQADCAAGFFARPALGAFKKMKPDSLRAAPLVNNQTADFSPRVRLHRSADVDSQPAGDFAAK